MIEARELVVERDGRRVLDAVSFEATAGEVGCILGPNGAGKSTLLAAIAGLVPIASGTVRFEGVALGAMTPRERARCVAYVPQQTELRSSLSVETVVSHGRYAHTGGLGRPGPKDLAAIERSMARTDVAGLRGRRFDRLSTGEQRRVLIARALATQAPAILLDEPTAALDVRHALELLALLGALARDGLAVVAVLHGLDAARRHAARATLLDRGRLVAAGPTAEVIDAERVRAVYGVELLEGAALGFRLEERG